MRLEEGSVLYYASFDLLEKPFADEEGVQTFGTTQGHSLN